jgi:hypothetical protein
MYPGASIRNPDRFSPGSPATVRRELKPFIERPELIMIPDTSAFLEGEYFTDSDWQALIGAGTQPMRLIVPMLVIEELDAHKRGWDRQPDRVLSTLRRLWELGGSGPGLVAQIPAVQRHRFAGLIALGGSAQAWGSHCSMRAFSAWERFSGSAGAHVAGAPTKDLARRSLGWSGTEGFQS